MHKIDDPTAAPGGLFTIGDPIGPTPATVVTDDWLNAVQTELVNVIEGAGLTLDKANNAQLLAAIQALVPPPETAWQTGDVKLTMQPTAADGWIICNDGSIGNAASAASTRANDDCEALYSLLWANVSNTYAPVSGGRGASAAGDWAAGKTIGLTRMLGRALAVAGSGASLTARDLGQFVGEETHTLNTAEMPSHNHGVNDPGHAHDSQSSISGASGPVVGRPILNNSGAQAGNAPTASSGTGISIQSNGGGAAHNNMQPTAFLHAHIKL